MELGNCANCGKLILITPFNDLCKDCIKEEEEQFEKVNRFLKKKENRTASMEEVVTATGVKEEVIYKLIKKGRIQLIHFPNLGYPCEICGKLIRMGKLCQDCSNNLEEELSGFKMNDDQERRERPTAYYAISEKYRKLDK